MSSIAGFFQPEFTFAKDNAFCTQTIHAMANSLSHRGKDRQGFYFFPHGCFYRGELFSQRACFHIENEKQPTTKQIHRRNYTLFYDGCITNFDELKSFCNLTNTATQEDIIIASFLLLGPSFIKKVKGSYALGIYDETSNKLFLYRDPLGLRPLYYSLQQKTFLFSSEIKGLFAYPDFSPKLELDGLNEIFSMGPAHTPGHGIFKGIKEIKPGHCICFGKSLFTDLTMTSFSYQPHNDSLEDCKTHCNELLKKSLNASIPCKSNNAALVSGGLDSSIVSAYIESKQTYSFDFPNSAAFFKANDFQPSLDAPYVKEMVEHLGSNHHPLLCSNEDQFTFLNISVDAHDLPAMADIDASLLYFCGEISSKTDVIYTGECADELYCGYPWYHKKELYESNTFPWACDTSTRFCLLQDSFLKKLDATSYMENAYKKTCQEVDIPAFQTPKELLHFKTFYLTLRFFMQTLIDRTDRCSSFYGLDARVPFADYDLAVYLGNTPLSYKLYENEPKYLLREFAKSMIPESIRTRKKSPYPKTYDTGYEQLVKKSFLYLIEENKSPLFEFVDKEKALSFCNQQLNLTKPWYGQLMAGPQLLAYYLQIDYWLKKFNIG